MKDTSTLRLESSSESAEGRGVTAIRWVCAGARSSYSILDRALIRIGRGSEADVELESGGVSRIHAEIYRQGSIYALRDTGSTNGSYVNGRRVEHAALSPGDVLRLGDMLGVVARVDAQLAREERDFIELAPGLLFGPGLHAQLAEVRQVAASALPVVVVGETGTGKDCMARAVHLLSGRKGAFHAVNCAALPVGLAEAELFGHRKGAFTGAEQSGLGHLRAADKGTLFLDEFAELSLPIQAKLLRALQDGSVMPLGETRAVQVDVRVVAASQTPMAELVAEKRVRADLAARLNGITLDIPALSERRADIAILFDYFLRQLSGGRPPSLEPRLLERLLLWDWPGNVRELELVTRKLLVIHGHESLLKANFLPKELQGEPERQALPAATGKDRAEHDLQRFTRYLKEYAGNVARAAAAAGISRQRAYRLLKDRSPAELMNEPEVELEASGSVRRPER
jgi:sigma-54 dependent transcriptional regulator, acetoin dehydrogenase operon transcriptional activator AcoR